MILPFFSLFLVQKTNVFKCGFVRTCKNTLHFGHVLFECLNAYEYLTSPTKPQRIDENYLHLAGDGKEEGTFVRLWCEITW